MQLRQQRCQRHRCHQRLQPPVQHAAGKRPAALRLGHAVECRAGHRHVRQGRKRCSVFLTPDPSPPGAPGCGTRRRGRASAGAAAQHGDAAHRARPAEHTGTLRLSLGLCNAAVIGPSHSVCTQGNYFVSPLRFDAGSQGGGGGGPTPLGGLACRLDAAAGVCPQTRAAAAEADAPGLGLGAAPARVVGNSTPTRRRCTSSTAPRPPDRGLRLAERPPRLAWPQRLAAAHPRGHGSGVYLHHGLGGWRAGPSL